jgi:hypothetical protein
VDGDTDERASTEFLTYSREEDVRLLADQEEGGYHHSIHQESAHQTPDEPELDNPESVSDRR